MTYEIIDNLYIDGITNPNQLSDYLFTNLRQNSNFSFNENQRLAINLGGSDYYLKDQSVGIKLKLVFKVVRQLGMTPKFILIRTTNPDIKNEIELLASLDKLDQWYRLDSEILEGEYEKTPADFVASAEEYVYGSSVPSSIDMFDLTEKEKHLLTKSKTFCMLPWSHINASPNGQAMPCCMWDSSRTFANVKTKTLEQVWNSTPMKALRLSMINDIPVQGCNKCYEEERAGFFSPRQNFNKHLGHHIKKVTDTQPNGHVEKFEMTYWDIRFSNLCNLSCRSCGHTFSSSWYQDQKSLSGETWGKNHKALFWAGRHETDMLEQLMEHIDYVEQVYFAGGEPLMMDEHYQILEELERRKKFNVRLVYNTNFTKTKLKDRQVFDYWRKFDSVSVGASLDAMGPRAEYIRKGTDWAEVEENRKQMMKQCPGVDFYISPTLSILNVLHLPDFHRNWVERGLIRPQDLNINLLVDPSHLQVSIATPEYKEEIRKKYEEHIAWLEPLDKFGRAVHGFRSTLNLINDPENLVAREKFWDRQNKLDELRNENLLDVLPELNAIA